MSKLDYRSLGLKVGLEIHQQLDTQHKLFCNCPTLLTEEYKATLERYLRPVMSEIGEVDVAALFEWEKGKKYVYRIPEKSSCLVECDEEPPHEMNREAVKIGIAMTLAFKGKVVDEIYVMRKEVIDGSNTSGFQRTSIVGLGGSIQDEEGEVVIQTVAIEEDAARKIEDMGKEVVYNLDRLGIPLIEISTAPDIHSPEQAKRVAFKIGQMLRLTGKVKRGLGTIRQDLNVSIARGVKIEIKGVQELDLIPTIIENEALRQYNLLRIRDELKRRVTKDEVLGNFDKRDLTDLFQGSKSKVVQNTLKSGGRVYGIKVKGFKGIFGWEVMPNRRFGTEVADYVRVLAGLGGIFHSDELPNYGITNEEVKKVKDALGVEEGDAFVLIVGPREKLEKAYEVIRDRVLYAFEGVPKETRGAQEDGTTRFLRPQPGSARMYPETDIPPIRVTEQLLAEAKAYIPPSPEEKLKSLVGLGLGEELAKQIINSPRLSLFEELTRKYSPKVPPVVIATTIENTVKYVKSKGGKTELITDNVIEAVIAGVYSGVINKDSIPEILLEYSLGKGTINELISRFSSISDQELEKIVKATIQENLEEIKRKKDKAFNLVMGRVMAKVRGKAEGKKVAELIKRELEKI
ncbi:MAG: Glu-tRNA(Gln) amidotransferase subunit GatE [Candidatus Aramenus sp.]|jgi:glutamyl-tRNA(Gln) amidotransferase subunit E|nr:Glu-tRNA(Gln) amidotransferase subunit GatE [Candidatus Aramenus sp.]